MSVANEPTADSADSDRALVAKGYDAVYTRGPDSPTLGRLWQQHAAGADYPSGFGHISFLTRDEATQLAEASGLDNGDLLVDLACGAGGPGLLIARDTGASLLGIDLSSIGVAQALARAQRLGFVNRAKFRTGSFEATGLDDGVADAVMTIDAFQYSPAKAVALDEIARIVRPGGRFIFTAFEVDPAVVDGYPVLGTDPIPDYRPAIEAAGLTVDAYDETPGWNDRLTSAFQAVLDERDALTDELGLPGYSSLELEVSITLGIRPYRRRVLAVCTKR